MIHGKAFYRALCWSRLVDVVSDVRITKLNVLTFIDALPYIRHSNIFLPLLVLWSGKPRQHGLGMPEYTV